MDYRLILIVILDVGLLIFAIVTIVSPQTVWGMSAWRYRNRESMAPSPRRYRMIRAAGAAQLSLYIPPLVGILWPGDGFTKLYAGLAAAGVCVVAIITILAISSAVGAKRRRDRARAENVPVSELSEAGYSAGWFQVGYTFFYVILVGLILAIGFAAVQAGQRDYQSRLDATMSSEDRQRVNEIIDKLNPVVGRQDFELLPAVPEGALVGYPRVYSTLGTTLRITQYVRSCDATGVVLIETAEEVSVGIVYDASGAAAAGLTPEEFCPFVIEYGRLQELFSFEMAEPLGDRSVVSMVDGRWVPHDG